MNRTRLMRTIVLGIMIISLTSSALPQSFTGTVSGRVIDSQNAVIPGANLTLKNLNTNATRQAVTDDNGDYQFISVAPGRYELSAEMKAKGFSAAQITIEVTVASSVRADISLRPAGVTGQELGQATTTAPNLEPLTKNTDASLETLITQRQIVELPMLTRNVYELVNLAPGTVPTSEDNGGLVGTRGGAGIGLAVNGQRSSGGNYVLDGGENNNTFDGGPAQILPADAIKEFRVTTNNYTAEYGRNAGFIANIVSNTGGNNFHGSFYEFLRNSALAANSFDNNARGFSKPVFTRNQFGGAIGGPILRDKLFFFGTVEPIIVRSVATQKFYVPTEALKAVSSPGIQALFNTTRTKIPTDISTSDVVFRTVCPFGRDCTANPSLAVTVPAYGAVTRTTPANVGAGFPQDTLLASARLDYNINSTLQLFGRYTVDDEDIYKPVTQPFSADLDRGFRTRNQNLLFNLTRVWSSHLVSESRFIYGRSLDNFPATATLSTNYFPQLIANFFTSEVGNITLPAGQDQSGGVQNLYQFYQTASLSSGNHFYRFGGQYVQIRDNRITPTLHQLPSLFFNGTQSIVSGLPDFSILTLDPKGKTPGESVDPPFFAAAPKRHYRYNEVAFFVQDTWKVSRRLTISPGLRWEYFGVLHSTGNEKNLDANFYYGDGSNIFERIHNGRFSLTSQAPHDYQGHFYRPDYNNFAPRLGLAFDVFGDGSTVLRSGVGVFYDRAFGNQLENVSLNPPSYVEQAFGPFSISPNFLSQSPFQPIIGPNGIELSNVPARHIDQNLRTAYTVAWNIGIAHQFSKNLAANITYVGASGVKLYSLSDDNRFNSGIFIGQPASNDLNVRNALVDNVAELNTRGNLGHSSYHGLQFRVESGEIKNLGLQFGANYTWSHSIDNASSVFATDLAANPLAVGFLDAFNPDLDRGDSDFDVRHRFVTNFIWEIPFGKTASNRLVKHVLAGWGISGILSFQTGQPFSIFDRSNPEFAGLNSGNPRPLFSGAINYSQLIPNADPNNPNSFLYLPLNPVADSNGNCVLTGPFFCSQLSSGPFSFPFNGRILNTVPRNIFRRPGTQYHNMALEKNFALPKIFGREGVRLQLRGEFYGIFNHANLYVIESTNDVGISRFQFADGQRSPGVQVRRGNGAFPITAGLPSYIDNRQIVIAAKIIF